MTALSEWQNFYVILGSSAGALIGLQFVAMALIANRPHSPNLAQAGAAFSTPTVVHFTAVLLLAGVMSAPWHGIASVAACWGAGGLAGVVYSIMITVRLKRQPAYHPEFEDWLFHAVLPLVAYAALIVAAAVAFQQLRASLASVAAATILLLLIGIHNAWDSVTYHIFVQPPKHDSH
jgi:hypothetical protein